MLGQEAFRTPGFSSANLPQSGEPAQTRVCLITTEFHGLFKNGGIGTANTGLALALAGAGFQVTVAYADADASGPRLKVGNFLEVQELYRLKGITLDFVPADPLVVRGFDDCRSASYCVYLYLKQRDFDVVYFNDCGGQGYYSLLAKRTGVFHNAPRMYVVAHGPQEWVLKINSILWDRTTIAIAYMERRAVELADALISPSRYMIDWMRSNGWRLPDKVLVIQNIITLPEAEPSSVPASAPASIQEIVFFGRLEVRKGIELFCNAIDLLNKDINLANIHVTFMGKFGKIAGLHSGVYVVERARPWRSSLHLLCKLGQQEAVTYLRRPGVLAVIPSNVENSPCVVAECLELGIPFVASGTGGTPELVASEYRDLCLVAPEAGQLASRLGAILKDGHPFARLAIPQGQIKSQWLIFTAHGTLEPSELKGHDASAPRSTAPMQTSEQVPAASICLVHSSLPPDANAFFDSLLRQTCRSLEIVLYDDSPNPAFAESMSRKCTAQGIPFHRVAGAYGEKGSARNAAAAQATGSYLLFVQEGGVLLRRECIETMLAAAMSSGAAIVTTMGMQIQRLGRYIELAEGRLSQVPLGACTELGAFENCFGSHAFLIARQSFSERRGFEYPYHPEIEDWLFLATSVLAGLHLEVVPEPLFFFVPRERTILAQSTDVDNRRRVLSAYRNQKVETLEHIVEALSLADNAQGERLRSALADMSSEAREIALRISSQFEMESEEAIKGLVRFCIERHRFAEALDIARSNGEGLLDDLINSLQVAVQTVTLDSIRKNTLELWHAIDLTFDIRRRVRSVSVFPACELSAPAGTVASHLVDIGVRVLKAAAVVPSGAGMVRTVATVEARQPASVLLALAVSSCDAQLRLSGDSLDSTSPFWWSGWSSVSGEGGTLKFELAIPEPGKDLLDLHFLSKARDGAIDSESKVTWESVSASVKVDGAYTSSGIVLDETAVPVERAMLDQGVVLTDHSDFPFPVFVPGDPTLLLPLPGRAVLVRLPGALFPGATGVRSVVSVQRVEAHPIEFAVWARPVSKPVTSPDEFAVSDAFSGWFPVTDKLRQHVFALMLSEPAREPMDIYLSTRVVDFPDVHFCHAVWHQLLILGKLIDDRD